jgi:hypothetical protein
MTYKKKGIILIIVGVLLVPVSLSTFAISKFVTQNMTTNNTEYTEINRDKKTSPSDGISLGATQPTSKGTTVQIFNTLLSTLPLIGIFILLPLGIVLTLKKEKPKTLPPNTPSPPLK